MTIRVFVIFTTAFMSFCILNFVGSEEGTITESINGLGASSIIDKGNHEVAIPPYLYIIVSWEVWEESLRVNELTLPHHHEQFIHLAKEDQVPHVAEKFWSGVDYVILKIESNKMIGHLVYETNPVGSNKYFHLYDGTIPLDAVVESTLNLKRGQF